MSRANKKDLSVAEFDKQVLEREQKAAKGSIPKKKAAARTAASETRLAEAEPRESERHCRVCGCTDLNACPGGCTWIEKDLCSACRDRVADEQERSPVAKPVTSSAPAIVTGDTDTGASEPYEWDRCTKVVTLRMLPKVDGVTEVIVAARTHLEAPVIRSVELPGSDLQVTPTIIEVLTVLQEQLPVNAARRAEELRAAEEKRKGEAAKRKAEDQKRRDDAAAARTKAATAKKERAEKPILNKQLKEEIAKARETTKAAKATAAQLARDRKALERERAKLDRERAKLTKPEPVDAVSKVTVPRTPHR